MAERIEIAEQENKVPVFNKVMRILAFPLSAAAGFWAMHVNVHNNAYNQAKKLGGFDDILKSATDRSSKEVGDRIANRTTLEAFSEKWPKSKIAYQEAAEARMEFLGLDSFRKKWNYMAKECKQEALLVGLTASGIAIGALLSIANSRSLHSLFSDKQNEKNR